MSGASVRRSTGHETNQLADWLNRPLFSPLSLIQFPCLQWLHSVSLSPQFCLQQRQQLFSFCCSSSSWPLVSLGVRSSGKVCNGSDGNNNNSSPNRSRRRHTHRWPSSSSPWRALIKAVLECGAEASLRAISCSFSRLLATSSRLGRLTGRH